jgi:hypothetical protein
LQRFLDVGYGFNGAMLSCLDQRVEDVAVVMLLPPLAELGPSMLRLYASIAKDVYRRVKELFNRITSGRLASRFVRNGTFGSMGGYI